MWLMFWLVLAVPGRALQAPTPAVVTAQAEAVSSKIWIGRYAEVEEFIRSAKIERMKDVGTGVTSPKHAYFAPGGLAGGVVAKNIQPGKRNGYWESYKSAIAAYRMDRLLDMDMVPPTVERNVDGTLVSVQLWVDNTRMLKELKNVQAPNPLAWNYQVHRQKVFDDLIANIDENAGNVLVDPAWNLILIDHSRCFTVLAPMPFPLAQIDRPFFDKLKALTKADVQQAVGSLLETGAVDAIMRRRDGIVATFEKLVREKGEAAVFLPYRPPTP